MSWGPDQPGQVVHVDGVRVQPDESCVYLAFNKPPGCRDEHERRTGRRSTSATTSPTARNGSSMGRPRRRHRGPVLLTNDGELALIGSSTHAMASLETYLAQIPGPVPRDPGKRPATGDRTEDGMVAARLLQGGGSAEARPRSCSRGRKAHCPATLPRSHPVPLVRTRSTDSLATPARRRRAPTAPSELAADLYDDPAATSSAPASRSARPARSPGAESTTGSAHQRRPWLATPGGSYLNRFDTPDVVVAATPLMSPPECVAGAPTGGRR